MTNIVTSKTLAKRVRTYNWDPFYDANYQIRNYQKPVVSAVKDCIHQRYTQRFNMFFCHRRGGKDATAGRCMMYSAITKPGSNNRITGPTSKQVGEIYWNTNGASGKSVIDEICPQELRKSTSLTTRQIILYNGSRINFGGSDETSGKGTATDFEIITEWQDCKGYYFDQSARPQIRERDGTAMLVGTPYGNNHAAKRRFAKGDEKLWNKWNLSIWNTIPESFPEEVILQELEDAKLMGLETRRVFAREYEGDFNAAITGAIYKDYINAAQDAEPSRVGGFSYNPQYPVHTAHDIGFIDDYVIWLFQVYDGKIFIIDHYVNSNKPYAEHYPDYLNKLPYKHNYGSHFLPHDSGQRRGEGSGKPYYREYQERIDSGTVVKLPLKDKRTDVIRERIDTVRRYFPLLHFNTSNPSVARGLEHVGNYRMKETADNQGFIYRKTTPEHDEASHHADALGYAIRGYLRLDKITAKKRKGYKASFQVPTSPGIPL